MSKEDTYIASMKRNNPSLFTAEKIQITPQSIEQLVRHAFKAGVNAAVTDTAALNGKMDDVFERIRKMSR